MIFVVVVKSMNKIFQEHFLDNPVFKLVNIVKSLNKVFIKGLQRFWTAIFKVGNFKSISKILEKHLQRNLLFRKLFHIYEKNVWNSLWRHSCFSVYRTPGYICGCLQHSTLKMFDISFIKPPSRKCMITHLEYSEDKVIYFLYIFILIYTHTHTHTRTSLYIHII